MFIAQNYPAKELCILMDIPGYTKDMQVENNIWQWGIPKASIGAKRNELCEFARGEIILNFDDDDTYAKDWISHSVNSLLTTKADLTGLDSAYFRDTKGQRYQYIYKPGQPYIIGATFCYWKRTWERAPFPDKQEGEDAAFCATAGLVLPHGYINGFEASIHANNTSKRHISDTRAWKVVDG